MPNKRKVVNHYTMSQRLDFAKEYLSNIDNCHKDSTSDDFYTALLWIDRARDELKTLIQENEDDKKEGFC